MTLAGAGTLLALLLWLTPPLAAQDPELDPDPAAALTEDGLPLDAVTPGGAFLRSLVVPGWGHLASDSPTRGAFYVAAQTGSFWMIVKSFAQRRSAERFRESAREVVQAELRLQGVESPDSLRVLSDQDPRVADWDELRDTRSQQVEDWVTLGVFFTLLAAADAYVAAHLSDFPEPLAIQMTPWEGRGVEVRVSYPLGRLVEQVGALTVGR
jgi:hypothetical protein